MSPWLFGTTLLTTLAWLGWLALVFLQPDLFPERVPIHWNIHMEPDGWADASTARNTLVIGPLMLTLMLVLSAFIPQLSPEAFQSSNDRHTLHKVLFLIA